VARARLTIPVIGRSRAPGAQAVDNDQRSTLSCGRARAGGRARW